MNRSDFAIIAGWVHEGDRVLDLGCGDGELLAALGAAKRVREARSQCDPERS